LNSQPIKIVTILGARPQFIKAAAVSNALSQYSNIQEIIIHTGQHFDRNMSQLFFDEMHLPMPTYQLGIHGLPHGALTGRMMEGIESVLLTERPDWVMVYGDTDSTLAGALAARKLHIPVAHVESGLRSFNEAMPEEINRIVTDRISDLLFCPSETAVSHLHDEGRLTDNARIVMCGDVMKDAARQFTPLMKVPATTLPDRYILCTFHRAENVDNPQVLRQLLTALEQVCTTVPVVCPLHPHTRKSLESIKYAVMESPILFIDPVGYLEMLYLLNHSTLVMTDSGGLQKESYYMERFCITLRNETEWTELVECGYNQIVGTDPERILKAVEVLLNTPTEFPLELYGNGHAAEVIAGTIAQTI
jgi:UDP-GlcNAc3NAcA epimerase